MQKLKNEKDYNSTLRKIEKIWESDSKELDELISLVEKYEDKYYPILYPSKLSVLLFWFCNKFYQLKKFLCAKFRHQI